MENYKEIEKSIIKKYRKEIWSKFIKAVQEYKLINKNDKIMVCISGGKDSFLLAKCIEELQKHGKYPFTVYYVVMDPGYNEENIKKIEENARILNIKIEIFKSDIFAVTNKECKEKPCYLCARMRRGYLYSKAQKLGCNKIALGHHFNDVIETTLLSMFYGAETKTMLPKLHSDNFEGLELIRPLYLVKEKDILNWAKSNNLSFLNCACSFTDKNEYENTSKRKEIKELIKTLEKVNPNIEHNIFKALDNVNLNCVLSYIKETEKHSFLDEYDYTIINKDNLKESEIDSIVKRVKSLIINSNNEILLGYSNNEYQFPGGHVEEGETIEHALKREVLEETGIEIENNIKAFYRINGYYKDWPCKGKNRKTENYYFIINTDLKPNLSKASYTNSEKEGNFSLKYIPLESVEELLIKNKDTRGIAKEMLTVIRFYKNQGNNLD